MSTVTKQSKDITRFVPLNGKLLPHVGRAFENEITEIYGNQKKALSKIKNGLDRKCEVMLRGKNPIGFIVYKTDLQNEHGLENAFELKTLFLFDAKKNSGKGFGSRLFDRVDIIAKSSGANIIYCTAKKSSMPSIKCAIKNGFTISRESEEDFLLTKKLYT